MKYEQYKGLTQEQKEEWGFRFPHLDYPLFGLSWCLWAIIVSTAFSAITLVTLKEYVSVKSTAVDFWYLGQKVMLALIWIALFDYIGQTIFYFFRKRQESKWLKKQLSNNAKNIQKPNL